MSEGDVYKPLDRFEAGILLLQISTALTSLESLTKARASNDLARAEDAQRIFAVAVELLEAASTRLIGGREPFGGD